jgi:carbamoyltransferase
MSKSNRNKRNYIGLSSSFHDSSLAIVDSRGRVAFAEATERATQSKRAINTTPDLIYRTGEIIAEFCEPDAQLVIAHSWSACQDAKWASMLCTIAEGDLEMHGVTEESPYFLLKEKAAGRYSLLSHVRSSTFSGRTLEFEIVRARLRTESALITRHYSHHLTHAATACLTSPFDNAICAVLDGLGENRAYAIYEYSDGVLTDLAPEAALGSGSLGVFYSDICEACGFDALRGEEWKVMGLASYGSFDAELVDILRGLIKVDGLRVEWGPERDAVQLRTKLYCRSPTSGEPSLHAANIAFAGQTVYSEVVFELLNNLFQVSNNDNLALGGGCVLNSSTNGQILDATPFKQLHVFSAPADDGNSIGAALLAYQEDNPGLRCSKFQLPYLGSSMSTETIANVVKFGRIDGLSHCSDAARYAGEMLAQGKVIGWIRGRAEFGPRALGNRSILADPRSLNIKERLNSQVKFREQFRPFAPAILHEYGPMYFENYQESPYMERTLRFRPEIIDRVPGVVHVDGTGRLQTVKREWNEPFYNLVSMFFKLTSVPLVLNTSFNIMGKPIAHSVEDVLAVFYSTGLDAIFIDDVVIEKR